MEKQIPHNRIIWVDLCRLLCMFSVITLHSIFLPDGYKSVWIDWILGASYDCTRPIVPVLVFFFLSGWLQKPKHKHLEWKKAFLFFCPAILFWNGLQLLVQEQPVSGWESIIRNLGVLPIFRNSNEPLWFLSELMWYTLLLPIIHRIPLHVRIVLVILALWISNNHFTTGTWDANEYANNFAFFIAGTVAHNLNRNTVCLFFEKSSIWLVPVTLYLLFNSFLPDFLHYTRPKLMDSNALTPVVGMLSMFGVSILVAKIMPKIAGVIAGWAPAVFFLYASHWPLFTVYERIALHYDIQAPHPHLFPLCIVGFMLCGICLWKLAMKTNWRMMFSIVFLQPVQTPEKKSNSSRPQDYEA